MQHLVLATVLGGLGNLKNILDQWLPAVGGVAIVAGCIGWAVSAMFGNHRGGAFGLHVVGVALAAVVIGLGATALIAFAQSLHF